MKIPTVTLDQVKSRIAEKNGERQGGGSRREAAKDFFPFWLMPIGSEAVVRILPDINPDNVNFWYHTKFTHSLDIDGKKYSVVCPKTYEDRAPCPICDRSNEWYKAENKEKGLYYWKGSENGALQVLVLSHAPITDSEGNELNFEGQVCRTNFTQQMIQTVEQRLVNLDEDDNFCGGPTAVNFVLKSVAGKNDRANWSFSDFERKATTLTDEQMAVIEETIRPYNEIIPPRNSLEKLQHFLDAHDGEVELDLQQFNEGSSSGSDNETGDWPKSESRLKPKAVSETKPPVDNKSSVDFEDDDFDDDFDDDSDSQTVVLSDDDDDNELIRNILGRN